MRDELGFSREREAGGKIAREHRPGAWMCLDLREPPAPLGLVPTCRVGPGAKGEVGLCLGRFEHCAKGSELILEVKGAKKL